MALEDHVPYPSPEHGERVRKGDPAALAWEWIARYAENLSYGEETVTADELIETAMGNVEGSGKWPSNYLVKGGLLEGVYVDETFWDKLADLKGIGIPSGKRNNFFSCSC